MKERVVASRYGKAIILLMQERGVKLDLFINELKLFVDLWEKEREIRETILSPLIPIKKRVQLLKLVLDNLPIGEMVKNVVFLMFEKKRMTMLSSVLDFLIEYQKRLSGKLEVELVSARELDSKKVNEIQRILQEKTGKEVSLNIRVDPKLIEGVIIKIGDTYYDGSLRSRLENLRNYLIHYYG